VSQSITANKSALNVVNIGD